MRYSQSFGTVQNCRRLRCTRRFTEGVFLRYSSERRSEVPLISHYLRRNCTSDQKVIPVDLAKVIRTYTSTLKKVDDGKETQTKKRDIVLLRNDRELGNRRQHQAREALDQEKAQRGRLYLTQDLISHGYFQSHLHRMACPTSPNCLYCDLSNIHTYSYTSLPV